MKIVFTRKYPLHKFCMAMAEKSCQTNKNNSINPSLASIDDYNNFIKKSLEMKESLPPQVLNENAMRAAENAANICKNNHQWNFKSIKDNFQAHEQWNFKSVKDNFPAHK